MPWISGNRWLNQSEMENNAIFVWNTFNNMNTGWTLNAVCGMLGNMQSESTINPGIWENLTPFWRGYGLVQWTPYTNYANWAGTGWQDNGPKECQRIEYERLNGLEWIVDPNYPYNYDFNTFHSSLDTPGDLAKAFLVNYERPIASVVPTQLPIRAQQAEDWFTFLSGQPSIRTLPPWLLFQFSKWRKFHI